MIRLISLDLDGTLLDPSGAVTPATKAAIAQARSAGLRVVLNTGRPIPEAFWFAHEAGCDSLVCALGGGALADSATGQVIRRWDIEEPSGRQALELCLGKKIELMIFAGNEILADPFSKQSLLKTYPFPAFHDNTIVTADPLGYMEEHNLPLTKIHGDQNPSRYPLEELAQLPGIQLTASNDHDFELVAQGVDKGRTLALLAIAKALPHNKRVCLVFLDNNERNLLGASAFRKKHPGAASNSLFFNFDCVGDGEHLLLMPSKLSRWDESLLSALNKAFSDEGTVHAKVLTQGLVYYPSDHRKFKFHVAVCACRRLAGLGYYIPRLRTKRDTVLSLDNITAITEGIGRFVPLYLEETSVQ